MKIGEPGHGAGQLELAAPVLLVGGNGGDETGGSGVAVNDTTGDVYVADTGNRRVDEFTSKGVFVRAFGFGVSTGASKLQVCTSSCRAGLSGEAAGELETPLFIAVDNSESGEGDIYVGDTGDDLVTKYTSEGALVEAWGNKGALNKGALETPNGQLAGPTAAEPFTVLRGLAVDSNGHLWIDAKHPALSEMFEFEQAGTYTGVSWIAEAEPSGVAVNGNEELYVADGNPDVQKFTASGVPAGTAGAVGEGDLFPFPSPNFTGLAVDGATGVLYLDQETTIDAVPGSCPSLNSSTGLPRYCEVTESFGAPELTGGAGLAVDPNGAVVYAANTTADTVDQYVEAPPSPPSVASDSVSEVTATSAVLGGEVDPDSLSAEESAKLGQGAEPDTKYYFEYSTEPIQACAASHTCIETTAESLSPSFDAAGVSPAQVQGLTPGRTYHYRLVAENEANHTLNKVAGEERTFTTQAGGQFGLPDGRQWEMVSPVQKHGALIEPIAKEGIIQAAADGNAITYHANAPIESEPQGAMNEVQILSARGTGGWSSHDIEPSHSSPTDKPEGEGEPYPFFSENLQLALVQPAGAFEPGLSPESSETSPLLRTDYLNGNVNESCLPQSGMHCYRPLVTGCPSAQEEAEGKLCPQAVREHADVPAGTQFGEARGEKNGPCPYARPYCGPQLEGASANGEHVVFNSYAQLTETSLPAGDRYGGMYEWSDGSLQLVNILPAGEGGAVETGYPSSLGSHLAYNTRGAISENGSRVVWKGGAGLYLREHATQPPSPIEAGKCAVPADACTVVIGGGEFQAASKEITRVFSTSTNIGGALFEYNTETGKSTEIVEGSAQVQGSVLGVSEDGSYVYFVADGQLGSTAAEGAVKGTCTAPLQTPSERCNLYVYHGGTIKLVAVLSGEDGPDWAHGTQNHGTLTARVSANGRYLAFMSDRDLTGYDSVDATSGKPDEEVYLYDAGSSSHPPTLACASCEPTGARPHGIEYARPEGVITANMPLVGGHDVWEQYVSLAANIPGWTPYKNGYAVYQSRYLSNSGRLFFNSDDGLVPKDGNNNWDVYEYEPEGVPSGEHACGASSASGSDVFKPAREFQVPGAGGVPSTSGSEGAGCVALISGGQSNEESAFLDASESGGEGPHGEQLQEGGGDVFFLTTAKLAPQDSDSAFDVYDAHECTSASPCIAPPAAASPACNTEASCKAPPTPQPGIYGAPASATFEGAGNLTPAAPAVVKKVTKKTVRCKKHYAKNRKGKCVRVKAKRKKR